MTLGRTFRLLIVSPELCLGYERLGLRDVVVCIRSFDAVEEHVRVLRQLARLQSLAACFEIVGRRFDRCFLEVGEGFDEAATLDLAPHVGRMNLAVQVIGRQHGLVIRRLRRVHALGEAQVTVRREVELRVDGSGGGEAGA